MTERRRKRGNSVEWLTKTLKTTGKKEKKEESLVSDAARQKEVESHCHTYTKSYQPSRYISSFTVQRNGF